MIQRRGVVGWVAVGVVALGQSACTSMLPLDTGDAETALAAIEAGDRLSVVDSHGVSTDLVVTAVGADFIEGLGGSDQPVRIAAADVQEIRERRRAPGKTLGLAAGLSLLLFVGGLSGVGTMGAMQ